MIGILDGVNWGKVRMANMQIVPAYKNIVEAQYVEMMVPLYSYGCEKKIKKTLSGLKGNVIVFKTMANLSHW